jgi:cell division protein FtsB
MFGHLYSWFHQLLHRPLQVFWICVALAITGVILDGTALRLWALHRDHRLISERISGAQERSRQLVFKIHEAQQPEFIERAARDQFDLVKEGDLIFVFSDDGPDDRANPLKQ